jgi:heterotetrameric sarcosine oxidase beta subunit
MSKYSVFSLLKNAIGGNKGWERAWRDPEPKKHYDIVIVGAGGHGLASAFYLAKNHGIKNIAVLEKGYLGGGNTGRNTTIVRSNYMLDENALFYEKSLKLWEQLSQELNFNVMFSQRGVLNLAHSDSQMDAITRRGNTMRLNGIDAELLGRKQIEKMIPYLDFSDNARFQIKGGLLQKRGGTARHDAVAWGFARGADQLGVDIIQNCEVTGFKTRGNRITTVETSKGEIGCDKIGFAVAGNTGHLASKLGMKLPIESHVLQAFVSEPLKPMIDNVVTFGAGHFYVSQSDKGGLVFGGDIDMYNSYAQRGNLPLIEDVVTAGLAMIPSLSRLRIVRHWGGIMDMSMDGSPIIGKSPIDNLYLNCGWCYGGFKATPGSGWVFAHTIANDAPHELNAGLNFDRFRKGRSVDENGGGPVPNRH